MRALGIDPGLNITGYGVVEESGDGCRLVEAGVVRTNRKDPIETRLKCIHDGLSEIIDKYHPDALVLEKIFSHYKHPATSILMGHARGVVCLLCGIYNMPLINYPSTRLKKATVGNGRAGKQQVARMVMTQLGIKKMPALYDVTDALALALAHIRISKTQDARHKTQDRE